MLPNQVESTGTPFAGHRKLGSATRFARSPERSLYLVPPLDEIQDDDDATVIPSATVDDAAAKLFEAVASWSTGWARSTAFLAPRLEVGAVTRHANVRQIGQSPDILHNISLLVRTAHAAFDTLFEAQGSVKPQTVVVTKHDVGDVAPVTNGIRNREVTVDLEDEI